MAAMKESSWEFQSSHKKSFSQHEKCKKHREVFTFFCDTCSDLLCQKCVHNHDHIVLKVDEAADSYFHELTKIKKKIGVVDNELDQISNSLEEAKRNCKSEADDIKTKISEAVNSLIDIIRKREYELYREVDQKKDTVIKQIKETETCKDELSLSTDNVKGICEQLQADLAKHNFKRKEVIERLPGRCAILQRDVSQLKMTRYTGAVGIRFEPEFRNTAIPIGFLEESGNGNQLQVPLCDDGIDKNDSLVKLKTIECGRMGLKALPKSMCGRYDYQGCCLLTVDSMIESFVEPHTGDYAYFVLNKSGASHESLKIDIRKTDKCLNLSPTACDGGNIFLVYNETTIMKLEVKKPITKELPSKTPDAVMKVHSKVILSREPLYKISAVCWDENMKNCYALLHDGMTIKFIQFDSNMPEKVFLKLNGKVTCAGMCGFHVTGFGMAICDLNKKEVRYYATASSPEAKCVVKAPQKIKGAIPVCVTSRRKAKKWYVVWQYEVDAVGIWGTQTHSSIYQYSVSMQNEYLLLETGTSISSLGILGDKHICLQTFNGSSTSLVFVYNIQSTS